MNENNFNEERAGGTYPENGSIPPAPLNNTDDYTSDVFADLPAPREIKPTEYTAPESPKPTLPHQPQTPSQSYRPQQSPYSPVQNNQPPRAPQNPYGANRTPGYNPYQQPSYRPQQQPIPPQPPQSGGGKNIAVILIVVCAVIAVIAIGIGMIGGADTPAVQDSTSTSAQEHTNPTTNPNPDVTVSDSMNISTTAPSEDIPNSVYVAQKVRPSVVGVLAYYDGELIGEGSGVLMKEKDGWTYIVTCAHVIDEDGVDFGVLFLDGTHLEAELVAYDTRTDIGVVKVQKTGLPLAEFGDSSTLQVGEPIYAIGNPGGSEYFGSITDGIVASIDRSVTSTYTMTCIQHNAAINPGNSGGALVNTSGQIIGINSSKIASTEFEGMGFAVPTSIAGPVVDALISYGYVPNRPKLGITYAPVSNYQVYSIIASLKGYPQGSLVIASISDDSSLIGTEAKEGDLIIGVNGKEMTDSSVLLDLIETGNVGDTLTLTLVRINSRNYKASEPFDVEITLVEDKGYN